MTNEAESIAYFEATAVHFARTMLPVADARRFLYGMLAAGRGEDLEHTRQAYSDFCVADDQLELISKPSKGGRD